MGADGIEKLLEILVLFALNQGYIKPKIGSHKGHSHSITDIDKFKQFVDQTPDYTLDEFAAAWPEKVSRSTVGRTLIKLGYTRKKSVLIIKKEMSKSVNSF